MNQSKPWKLRTHASDRSEMAQTDVHMLLQNERRQQLLEILARRDGLSPRELSEIIAERESNQDPPPRNVRHSVYVALQQSHIPKLVDYDVVEYDEGVDRVQLGTHAADVFAYLPGGTKSGLTWSEYYTILSVSSVLTILGAVLDAPIIGQFSPDAYLLAVSILLLFSVGYHLWTSRRQIVHWVSS